MTWIKVIHETPTSSIDTTLDVNKLEETTIEALRSALDSIENDDACWVRASEQEDWIRVPDNRLLRFLLQTYYVDRDIIIIFRPRGQPSPNATPQLSRNTSTVSEADPNLSGLHNVTTACIDNQIEPFTQISLEELNPAEVLCIKNDAHTIAVHWPSLRDFVTSKLSDGVGLFNMSLSAETKGGQLTTIQLTRPTWTRYILRGHEGADEMLELFASTCEMTMNYENELQRLHADTTLLTKIKIFINDLRTFGNSESAQARLHEDPMAKFFFSKIYFNEDEIERLLDFPTSSGLPVFKILEAMMSRKTESVEAGRSRDYELCASHDLAPLLQQVYGVQKHFTEEKVFKLALKKFEKDWRKRSC